MVFCARSGSCRLDFMVESIVAAVRAVLTMGTQTVCMTTWPRQRRPTSTCHHPKTERSRAFCTTSHGNFSVPPHHRKCGRTLSAALFVHPDLTAGMLVFGTYADMQVACCSQRSSPGCSSTIAVRPHAQASHAGSPPIATNSQHFLGRSIISALVSPCNLID
eukprot:COSAG02_NODE_7_length_64539_cov_120.393482_11_plen_162_part_00